MKKKGTIKTIVLIFAIVTASITILVGCESANKEIATIYLHLEKAANKESSLSKYQNELNNLQKEENKLYTSILNLKVTSKKIDPILDKARESLQKRQKLIQKENTIIENSYNEAKKIKPIMKKIDDQTLRNKTKKVANSINKRYEIYKKIYNLSNENIKADQKLYNYLQQKNIHITNYDKQIKKFNKDNKQLKDLKEQFNLYTKQYNKEKMTLYKAGNLKWSSK
ncbi:MULTISPECIES: YkyA family protein [Heyndrickxia]|uniref:YkyA family protein n=1 Tax=Heyndrickxia TaxID=2837504 RepID=UPI0015E70B69|nr:YkyA family protein [Heyndrickxia sporothermodurans]